MRRNLLQLAPFYFLFLSVASAQLASAQGQPSTAREVAKRIQEHGGVPWQKDTVDTFKAGDPIPKALASPSP